MRQFGIVTVPHNLFPRTMALTIMQMNPGPPQTSVKSLDLAVVTTGKPSCAKKPRRFCLHIYPQHNSHPLPRMFNQLSKQVVTITIHLGTWLVRLPMQNQKAFLGPKSPAAENHGVGACQHFGTNGAPAEVRPYRSPRCARPQARVVRGASSQARHLAPQWAARSPSLAERRETRGRRRGFGVRWQ